MQIVQIVLFAILSGISFYFFYKRGSFIYRNINLGRKDESYTDNPSERLKTMLLVAFGQKKMFQNWIPAVLHLFLYLAFVVTQIELIEIFIDGFSGQHRFLFHLVEDTFLEVLYYIVISSIEILSVLAFVATFAFLARRNLLKIPRFVKSELNGWPRLDANIILIAEIYLLLCIFSMNGADVALQLQKGLNDYGFAISSNIIGPALQGLPSGALVVIERLGWWGHIIGVLALLVYITYSKHLHIMLAFPNTYFSRLEPKGEIKNMPEITKEVKSMLDPNLAFAAAPEGEAAPRRFGAKDVNDLSWKNLLDAYSCTECGRCTDACPANGTGKLLSPRKIMMDTRDRLDEVGKNIDTHGPDFVDNKALLGDYISVEELRACTTCNACVQECPINISPLDIIVQLRRYLIMEESNSPEEWNMMFGNIENNGAPWKFSPDDRFKWAEEVK